MNELFDNLKLGTQIVYVPIHANGDVDHPDSQAGFITSLRPQFNLVFCRYWRKNDFGRLGTPANSEGIFINSVVIKDTVPQKLVDTKLAEILKEITALRAAQSA